MKVAIYTEYGAPEVLQIKEVEKPVAKSNEILVKVYATPINYGDIIARNFRNITPRAFSMPFLLWITTGIVFGFKKPKKKILGSEFAGQIEAVGKDVKRFKKGDLIFGYRGMNFGANAEYLCMPENGLVSLKPVNMDYKEAATVPYGAMTSLNLLRKVNIQRGQKVLIIGASGAIGSYAVQFAKYFGAEVTGVCSTHRIEMVKALGADKVIDYTVEDFTQSDETYDLIFDILNKSSFAQCKKQVKEGGIYLLASFKAKQLFQMLWTKRSTKRVICALSTERAEDLDFIKGLVEVGKIKTIVDRCFSLEEIAKAHRYVEKKERTGKVVVTMEYETVGRL